MACRREFRDGILAARSRGLMGCVMQAGFPIGFALASAVYGLLFDVIGWRGLFWVAALPSVPCLYLLWFVKEPPVWLEIAGVNEQRASGSMRRCSRCSNAGSS